MPPRPAAATVASPTLSVLRPTVWALHVALPLLGQWLLLAQLHLDVLWEDQVSHFWLILLVAGVMQRAIEETAAGLPSGPRFRVGINSGLALVGNIGSEEFRNFTAIGDTTNLAARLEGQAPVGSVLIGQRTRELLGEVAVVEPVGELRVKGKERPVRAFVLRSIREGGSG